jgi:uncharacterized protein YceH (UPF0502 family)
MHGFADLAAVHDTLDRLVERGHVVRLDRRPGQKEERYEHLLGGGDDDESAAEASIAAAATVADTGSDSASSLPAPGAEDSGPDARLERLERELGELRVQIRQLREALGEPSSPQA